MYRKYVKRFFDIVISLLGIVALSPLFLGVALAVKLDDAGPVIFSQKRIGKDKFYFNLYKFRSMKTDTPDIPTHLFSNPEKYISRVGKFIRKTSIDELPQLWNILKGDMSIIGPRPALWNQDDLIAERDKYGANGVKPGLTGLAQVSGRDKLRIPEKARFDGEYAECLNKGGIKALSMDFKCFIKTFAAVLKPEFSDAEQKAEASKEREKAAK